jgi:hypothetical protein
MSNFHRVVPKVLSGLFVLVVFALPTVSGSGGAGATWVMTAVKKPLHAKKTAKRACQVQPARRRRGNRSATRQTCKRSAKAAPRHTTRTAVHPASAGAAPAAASTPACCSAPAAPSAPPASNSSAPILGASNNTTSDQQAPQSAWDYPAMVDPTTVEIGPNNYNLQLDQSKDYILQCPPGPVDLPSELSVWGGHDVVLQDCDLEVNDNWVAYLHNQTGTMWVHDVHFGGTNLGGGVQLQEPGATVVMRDVLFDDVYGSYTTNHAELIQTWSGPARLLIDGLTGSTNYQGLYLLPNQAYTGPEPTVWDLRNIDIDNSQGGYALWVSDQDGAFPLNVQNVWVVPNPTKTWRGWWLWGFAGQDSNTAGEGTWANVNAGAPPGGSFVHATPDGASGVDENVSPTPVAGEQP